MIWGGTKNLYYGSLAEAKGMWLVLGEDYDGHFVQAWKPIHMKSC